MKYKDDYYDQLIFSWTNELNVNLTYLEVVEAASDVGLNNETRNKIIKNVKNRIKRCKYNITIAKNLKKKA